MLQHTKSFSFRAIILATFITYAYFAITHFLIKSFHQHINAAEGAIPLS